MSPNPPVSESDAKRLLPLASHPGWMSLRFLAFASGDSEDQLLPWLTRAERSGWLETQEHEGRYWRLKDPALATELLKAAGEEKLRDVHRRLYAFLATLEPFERYAPMRAFHAAAGNLAQPAFEWNTRWAEYLSAEADHEGALAAFRQALKFADGDFKRAYLQGGIASECFLLGRFAEAAAAWEEGVALAEKVGWKEWELSYSLNLGNVYSHLARFHDSEKFFRKALANSSKEDGAEQWVQIKQNLGAALIEQGKYKEALEEFQECRQSLSASDAALEKAIATMHLARVYNALGMAGDSSRELETAENFLKDPVLGKLRPYLSFLEGRFEMTQGKFAPSFRIFEDAAIGFERAGDLAGKVEVLLTISAILLEYGLIKEAHGLVAQLADWEGLVKFPALQHAIRLRRLSLGAFSGNWVQDDIKLLLQNAREVGRIEDWLQFWFHLSLAARRIGKEEWADTFLGLAQGIADGIAQGLSGAQRPSFARRPDIARLGRLSGADAAKAAPAVRARRSLPSMGPAEAATVAPPVKGKDSEEN